METNLTQDTHRQNQTVRAKKAGRTVTTTLPNHLFTLLPVLLIGEASSEFTVKHINTNMTNTR